MRARRASAILHTIDEQDEPPVRDITELAAAHTNRVEGADLRAAFDLAGVHHGGAFAGLAAAHTAEGAATVLAEVALPPQLRAQQAVYGVHPALLDACFQAVIAHPSVQSAAVGGLLLPLGVRRLQTHRPARKAHYCYVSHINADSTGIEADLEVLDESGTVLVTVDGLQLGAGMSENRDRILNERLLTIEWQQRELPDAEPANAGAWLLVNATENGDLLTSGLTDALKSAGAECTTLAWLGNSDHQANAELLTSTSESSRSPVWCS